MSGKIRIKSQTGIYHVMLRGNNRQTIFLVPQDYDKFLELLHEKVNQKSLFLYAWCLMPNHVHLLLKEKNEPLDAIFLSLLSSFVKWYNAKYNRVGHLFQGRYKAEPVEDQTYFLRVFRYIHRNPIEANLCRNMEDYPYSSYAWYFCSDRYKHDDLILNQMRKDDFERYHREKDEHTGDFLEFDNFEGLSEEEIITMVESSGYVRKISEVKLLPQGLRAEMIKRILRAGLSYRKINELTGVSISVIRAVSRELHQEDAREAGTGE